VEGKEGCLREGTESGRLGRMFKRRYREWKVGKDV